MKAHKLIGRASGSLRDMLLIHARLQFLSQCPAAAPFPPWAHFLAAIPSLLPPLSRKGACWAVGADSEDGHHHTGYRVIAEAM